MSITFQHKGEDLEFGIEYVFSKAGDTIPPHRHAAALAHDVECLRGRVAVCFQDYANVLEEGQTMKFEWDAVHWITALKDGTAVFHRFVYGKPEQYNGLTAADRAGNLDVA